MFGSSGCVIVVRLPTSHAASRVHGRPFVGLWLYSYVQADSGGGSNDKSTWGQGEWCRWWMYEVAALEQQNPGQLPYPYFEMNLPSAVPLIQTDEGTPVYPAGSVTCWQANNDYAP